MNANTNGTLNRLNHTKEQLRSELEVLGLSLPKSANKTELLEALDRHQLVVDMGKDAFRPKLCWWMGLCTPVMVAVLGAGAEHSYTYGSWIPCVILAVSALAILSVSLVHLAEGIQYITGSGVGLSWLCAVAIDVGLVGVELSIALDGIAWWSVLYLVGATFTSMALNVHGFLHAGDR